MTRATSERGYYVRGQASQMVGDDGLDVAITRDGIVNNLNHIEDQAYQKAGDFVAQPGSYWTQTTTTPGTYLRLDSMPPMFVPLRMQGDQSSSRVVCILRGYTTNATFPAKFRVTLSSLFIGHGLSPAAPSTVGPTISDLQTPSTNVTTLTATLYVSRLFDSWRANDSANAALYGFDGNGAPSAVKPFLGMVEVWATSDDATTHPRLEGLSVRTYVG